MQGVGRGSLLMRGGASSLAAKKHQGVRSRLPLACEWVVYPAGVSPAGSVGPCTLPLIMSLPISKRVLQKSRQSDSTARLCPVCPPWVLGSPRRHPTCCPSLMTCTLHATELICRPSPCHGTTQRTEAGISLPTKHVGTHFTTDRGGGGVECAI